MNCVKCNSENYKEVRKPCSNGTYQYRMQCFSCGYLTGSSENLKRRDGINYLDYNEYLHKIFIENERLEWKVKYDEERKQKDIERQEQRDADLRKWHNENDKYYFTDEWKGKRAYVLRRDNYLCQMCITNPAIHVHHLSYQHFGNELTCELISVCERCHAIIHEKEIF